MAIDSGVRERVVFLGGKAAGIDCPECELRTCDVDIDGHSLTEVTCPDCGATVLTEEQKAQLRRGDKF